MTRVYLVEYHLDGEWHPLGTQFRVTRQEAQLHRRGFAWKGGHRLRVVEYVRKERGE